MNPDRLAELEEERRFLLASIRDLDREHGVGDVDDADHTALRDGYVARAAAVLREIESGRSAMVARPRRPWWRRAVVPVATLAVGVALGLVVRSYAGQRLPGQSLTGGLEMDKVTELLAIGRSKLSNDLVGAQDAYQQVLAIEPDNAEARTYLGWLVVLDSRAKDDPEQLQQGIELLHAAVEADPTYADPHCLLAVATGRFMDPPDATVAVPEANVCLASAPPADLAPMVQAIIDDLS